MLRVLCGWNCLTAMRSFVTTKPVIRGQNLLANVGLAPKFHSRDSAVRRGQLGGTYEKEFNHPRIPRLSFVGLGTNESAELASTTSRTRSNTDGAGAAGRNR